MKRLLAFLSVLAAAPAFPQGLELAALGGYTTPGGLRHDAQTVEDLKLKGSFTWGASFSFFFSPRLGVAGVEAARRAAFGPVHADLPARRLADFCDPFGFCQDWLHQFELSTGVVVRF